MRVVTRYGSRDVYEKAIVEIRALKSKMNQCIKCMPNENDAKFGYCGRVQQLDGGNVGEPKYGKSSEQ